MNEITRFMAGESIGDIAFTTDSEATGDTAIRIESRIEQILRSELSTMQEQLDWFYQHVGIHVATSASKRKIGRPYIPYVLRRNAAETKKNLLSILEDKTS